MSNEPRRLLVVDDDLALAQALAEIFQDDGFVVTQRHDGLTGLSEARDGNYDLIVLDVMLPKRNGFAVCADLRLAGVHTPLLMLTAKDGELDEIEGLEVGADDFLRKPFEHNVLLARVHSLLRRHDHDVQRFISAGPVTLHLVEHRVTVRAHDVAVTPREFELLEFLVRHADVVVTKEEILDAVWGDQFSGDPNIVEVYIGYLRRKIDVDSSDSLIRTQRGRGYQMTRT